MGSALVHGLVIDDQQRVAGFSPFETSFISGVQNGAMVSSRSLPFQHLPPNITEIGTQVLEDMLWQHNLFLYSTVGMAALILYEYFITFDLEVKYIWKSNPKVTLANGIFIFNRYFPFLRISIYVMFSIRPAMSDSGCNRGTDFNSYATMFNIAIVELLMLFRAWTLWDKSKAIGAILATSWLSAVSICIVVVRSNLHPIPGIIPLPPMWFLPCDRPSPYKYFVEYIIALGIEFISLSFMMGRISWLAIKSKMSAKAERARESNALRVLRALRRQGATYFAVVIFIMSFTAVSSFFKPLARTVVTAGVAPTFTSIACNRFIFALRGLYLEIGGKGIDDSSAPPSNRVRFDSSHIDTTTRRRRKDDPSYGGADIAVTRHDFSTRDLGTKGELTSGDYEDDEEMEMEKSPTRIQDRRHTVLTQPNTPIKEKRMSRLGTPLHHNHGMSSSTFLTSDGDSSMQGTRTPGVESEMENTGGILRALTFTHSARSPSSTSSKFGFGTGSTSTHGAGPGSTKAVSPERRGVPQSLHFPPDLERSPESPRTPGDEEDESGKGLGGKLGSLWWRRKQVRKSGSLSYGEVDRGDTSEIKARPRGKERHPLDHHYEMDTIHSQIVSDHHSELEDEESPRFRREEL